MIELQRVKTILHNLILDFKRIENVFNHEGFEEYYDSLNHGQQKQIILWLKNTDFKSIKDSYKKYAERIRKKDLTKMNKIQLMQIARARRIKYWSCLTKEELIMEIIYDKIDFDQRNAPSDEGIILESGDE